MVSRDPPNIFDLFLLAPLGDILSKVLLYDCCDERCDSWISNHKSTSCIATSRASPCLHQSSCVKIILQDRKLWKSAREGLHRLLMATVLMNVGYRQEFARMFVKYYEQLYTDFIDGQWVWKQRMHIFNIDWLQMIMSTQFLLYPWQSKSLRCQHLHVF